jgi:hypothetical protein
MTTKKKEPREPSHMKDRELIEQMEALDEIIQWLESKDSLDMDQAEEEVDEHELDEWLKSPRLKKVRKWLEE